MKLAFFLVVLILNLRSIHRIKFLNIWAEDATVYATDALAHTLWTGWKTLFMPIAGYHTLIQRLIAWLGLAVPLDRYGLFYYEAYILCAAAVLAYLVHDDFDHIVPSKNNRVLLVLSLCFTGGLFECLGNLCNLHWYFSLALGFLFLRKLESRTTWKHVVAGTLMALSAAESIVFIPFFALRYYLKKKYLKRAEPTEIALSLVMIAIAVLNYISREPKYFNPNVIPGLYAFPHLFVATLYTLINQFIFEPILGTHLTQWAGSHEINFWLLGIFGVIFYTRLLFKTKTPNERLIYILILPFLGIVFLTWKAREAAFEIFFKRERNSEWWNMSRYAFIMTNVAAILALSQIPRLRARFSPMLFKVVCLIFIARASYYFEIFQIGSHTWASDVRELVQKEINCHQDYIVKSDPRVGEGTFNITVPGWRLCEFKSHFLYHEAVLKP